MSKKILLGMSGGVDSSVAALLLQKQGYEVTGMTMRLRPDEYMCSSQNGGCCSLDDIDDARRVCYRLGIEHLVMNFTQEFERDVIDPFAKEYQAGRTPNPCINCNRYLKFEEMLRRAKQLGFDAVATGHYAIVRQNEAGRWLLYRSPAGKDQSYALYSLTQYQLAHTLFPIGELEKPEVRRLAQEAELPVAKKPDSQEICFVEDKDYAGFIHRYTGQELPAGDFVDAQGNVLGRHKGITHYTVGQRKGLGISFPQPMYVTAIDAENNRIILGPEGSQYAKDLVAGDLNWIAFDEPPAELLVQAKVRYQAMPAQARVVPDTEGQVRVIFDEPQRAVTPGQAVVFYQDNLVIGGGTILK